MHVLTSLMTSLVLSPVAGERLAGSLRDCCVIKKDVRIPTRTGRTAALTAADSGSHYTDGYQYQQYFALSVNRLSSVKCEYNIETSPLMR